MGTGILICGLNGSGKSTLGKALAEALGFCFIDNEDLFFHRTHTDEPYANPRPRDEIERLLMMEVTTHDNFVFAAVRGDYGDAVIPFYDYAVVVEATKELRLQRIRNRSYQKFGSRMLTGGDLFEKEERFFGLAASRPADYVENWVSTLLCPVIRVDGTRPVEENVSIIVKALVL